VARHLVTWAFLATWGIAVVGQGGQGGQGTTPRDPFAFFQPPVSLTSTDRRALDAGRPIVRTLSASAGEVVVFSAARVDVDGARLVAWVRRIEELKRGTLVPAIGRFSDPPQIADLAALELEPDELDDLRRCRPRDCALKLHGEELATLAARAQLRTQAGRAATNAAYREALLARAQQYLASGLATTPPYVDGSTPVIQDREFAAVANRSTFLEQVPGLVEYLRRYPNGRFPRGESFLYWSKERLGGKPVVSITHVVVSQWSGGSLPEAIVAAKQVYASHYMTGSLAVTTILAGGTGERFLAYLNRSRVDILDGFLGGLVRRVMERRLREDAAIVVDHLRRRLQSGEPPAMTDQHFMGRAPRAARELLTESRRRTAPATITAAAPARRLAGLPAFGLRGRDEWQEDGFACVAGLPPCDTRGLDAPRSGRSTRSRQPICTAIRRRMSCEREK